MINLLAGIAIGDALGSTTEFLDKLRVLSLYRSIENSGYPFVQVGDKRRGLIPGAWTDDTEMSLIIAENQGNPEKVAQGFISWMKNKPMDIGVTIKAALSTLNKANGTPYWAGGYDVYRKNPNIASNGSLMRNGIIPGMCQGLDDIYTMTLKIGMITHFAPLPQICCMAQSYIIHELIHKRFNWDTWQEDFTRSIDDYFAGNIDADIENWKSLVSEFQVDQAFAQIGNLDVTEYNPFDEDFRFQMGYCLLSLKIGIWGLYHATHNTQFSVPDYPSRIFRVVGSDRIGWIAMLGYDSDTYCAIAGPMMVAAGLKFSKELAKPVLSRLEKFKY